MTKEDFIRKIKLLRQGSPVGEIPPDEGFEEGASGGGSGPSGVGEGALSAGEGRVHPVHRAEEYTAPDSPAGGAEVGDASSAVSRESSAASKESVSEKKLSHSTMREAGDSWSFPERVFEHRKRREEATARRFWRKSSLGEGGRGMVEGV